MSQGDTDSIVGNFSDCEVLTPAFAKQLAEKLYQALRMPEAEVTIVAKRGKLRWIRGPTPSEPIEES